ncbi:hypothetical protein SAMN04244572_02395 [Azotobacter beijerinckii]|uniref:Tail assembly protein n=1 Tax=Azotobacter beijerinckii TaxID=170623 RepID=A0A1H6V5H1_9GAMM|nr:hypothetical protein [Azotobacter beijerinckii]SEI99889.1 hypothetical protein SAMN04244572_02395 [Azotobacter beijerinckii]
MDPITIQMVVMVSSLALGYLMRPKAQKPKPAALSDFDLPVPDEGTPQAVFFGDCWTGDWQVLSFGRFRTRKVKTSSGK